MRITHAFVCARIAATSCAMFVCLAAPVRLPAQSPHLGPRIGYNFDTRTAFVSMQMLVPMTRRVEFYPSVDLYAPERGSQNAINGDLKVRFPVLGGPDLYTGGGLNIMTRSVGDFNRTHVGANLLFGLEGRSGRVHPFFETRVLMHETNSVQIAGGLNFTIGR